MDFVIWGAGTWGRRVYHCLKLYDFDVKAYIDGNQQKIGGKFQGKPVISFDYYLEKYRNYIIIIAMFDKKDRENVKKILEENGVKTYLDSQECPCDIYMPYNIDSCQNGFPMKEAVSKVLPGKVNGIIGIAGVNIFSMALYNYLKNFDFNVTLLLDRRKYDESIKNILMGDYNALYEDEVKEALDCILDTNPMNKDRYDWARNEGGAIPFYKFSWLNDYKNLELKRFKDIHKDDRRCFIVATGPSLRIQDLEVLRINKEICFSVNSIYKIFSSVSWRPDYYFAGDPEMLINHGEDIVGLDVPNIFIGDLYHPFFSRYKDCCKINRYHLLWDYDYIDVFSSDVTEGVYMGGSVVSQALQFAIYMGFREVYIIGADCKYYDNDGQDERSHFIADYANKKGASKPYVLYTDLMFNAYKAAKSYADENGIKIYNATRGGALEIFPRVKFESLFQ